MFSYFLPVSEEQDVKQHVLAKDCCPGEAFSTVWYVEQIAQVVFVMNVSISLGFTELAMSISAVQCMVIRTA